MTFLKVVATLGLLLGVVNLRILLPLLNWMDKKHPDWKKDADSKVT
jgi:hypothetical protein